MHEDRPSFDGSDCFEIMDDFGYELLVGPAELDAIEAFLMPIIEDVLRQDKSDAFRMASQASQKFSPMQAATNGDG